MPRQNRVTPTSQLIATSARGALMGNRGCLHDAQGHIRRHHRGKRWIYCRLHFRNRHRAIMTPGRYTELFFWDEAVALAAGHRPCAECQHQRYQEFRTRWRTVHPGSHPSALPTAGEMDAILHEERLRPPDEQRTFRAPWAVLPDGVFVTLNAPTPAGSEPALYLLRNSALHRWSPTGYAAPEPIPAHTVAPDDGVQVLTPRSIVRMLANGFQPAIRLNAQ